MVQIFAEFALLHRFFQIAMGGHDHPHVYPQRFVAANALHFAFFQYAQQLGLHRRRHIADFIQKQRAAIGLFEFPGMALPGAGEGAFFMAE